jgi:hypothetical protein
MFAALIVAGFMRGKVFGLRDDADVSRSQTAVAERSPSRGLAKLAGLSRRAAFGEPVRRRLPRNRGIRPVSGGRSYGTSL